MSVALTVLAPAAPTDNDVAALQASVTNALGVADSSVKNFVVAVAAAAERRLAAFAERVLAATAAVEWDVSFTVTADRSNRTTQRTSVPRTPSMNAHTPSFDWAQVLKPCFFFFFY